MSGEAREGWMVVGPPVRGRRCGSCSACCIQLPVKSFAKPANTRCAHLCSRGCAVYKTRPDDCRTFSCRWLMDPTTAGLRRPDKSGYVIDPMLDSIIADDQALDVVQVWVDPARPDAHEDPALRNWIADVAARYGLPTLIRWNSHDAMLLVAPILTKDDEWFEHRGSGMLSEEEMARRQADLRAPWIMEETPG